MNPWKRSGYSLVLFLSLAVGCGSLDNSDSSSGSTGITLLLKNPDESASGTAKAVDGSSTDLAVAKAFGTLSVTSCDISCTDGKTTATKTVSFSSGASEVSAEVACPAGSDISITATCADTTKTSNSVKFGFSCSTTASIVGSDTVTCSGRFLNQATRSSGDCRYARFAQDNNTQVSAECGFSSALTDTQKTTAKCNIELNAANSATSPGTVDTSSDGLQSPANNPYIVIEGGLNNPSCFKYNTSGTKELRGTGSWATDADSNTKAVCKFGVRHWRQFDSDRNFRYAASCTKDGSAWVIIPSLGTAEGKTSDATDSDVASLTNSLGSCSTDNNCGSGFCSGNSLCASAAPVGLAADVTDAVGPPGATTSGTADGAATTARFNQPADACISPNGQAMYITDSTNNTVRKIDLTLATTSGSYVSTFAGQTLPGAVNGACIGTASFDTPESCVVNSDNSAIFVTESGNDCIRKITISGCTVSTFAGSCGSSGSTNGTGTDARFDNPKGIDIDSNGILYIADNANHLIRKITSGQVVTTLAGTGSAGSANGTGTAASFNVPRSLVLDPTGTFLYVADRNNASIRKINVASGEVTTLVSSLTNIVDVAIDPTGTNLYATVAATIRKIVIATGTATTIAGSGTNGIANGNGTSATFRALEGVILDLEGDTLYTADTINNKIRQIQ